MIADTGNKKPGSLTPAAIEKLHRVIKRCNDVECEWIQPGIDSGLPFHDAQAQITAQRDAAKAALKGYGAPLPDSGTS
jgi:hypothetical protein